jgi:hypothetical protein
MTAAIRYMAMVGELQSGRYGLGVEWPVHGFGEAGGLVVAWLALITYGAKAPGVLSIRHDSSGQSARPRSGEHCFCAGQGPYRPARHRH